MKPPKWVIVGVLGTAVVGAGVWITRRPAPDAPLAAAAPKVRAPEAVAALGQLKPAGEVRRLAAPVSGFGGTPRILALLVNEGDQIRKGQPLAIFDSRPQIEAEIAEVDAQIQSAAIEVELQQREVSRYAAAAKVGAAAMVAYEEKQDELRRFQREGVELIAKRRSLETDLAESELLSPVNGTVLKIHSRVGERPSSDGVMEVGASQSMEALVEVYESDINRISIGQPVTLTSENGGFQGTLEGRVERITPQVRQRQVLSTDPTGDADARIIEVDVVLSPESAQRVTQLSGLKVIARFKSR
ncbi:HlyD family efflux transporter periplasmic adaptor subunit [Synechococcus sp. CC9311]|uniref:HlyD family efflux transporter periplasmic adaptor subunit n=1 Tax=Synechococcus sp. (strain CC9311) TaxID=64471 RepID=UPI0000DDAF62|nr:HlyD family efflux transporter periplasmic adaptor subunit [Synechococcus sp. CC9311]ABI47835.1 possible ABC transporter component [Synechococcus sp. CC9311]